MMLPDTLIVDIASELQAFSTLVCDIDMPHVDMDAALSQICSVALHLERFDWELAIVAYDMGRRDALFENAEFDDDTKDRITVAVTNLGYAIKRRLIALGLYKQSHFPFRYSSMLTPHAILLSKICTV